MIKICFVCHGNICRSPAAEFIFKKMVNDNNLSDKFYIDSKATSSEEISYSGIGNPVYPPMKSELKKHNINCDGKTAVQIKESDYKIYDYIICMDSTNYRNLSYLFNGDPDKKVHKLMDFTNKKGDVSDPWYTRRFDIAYSDIYEGCLGLIKYFGDKI